MPAKPLADLIDDCLAPALKAQGFAGRAIVALWPEIVGERLSARSRPLRIDWPRRRPAPGETPEPATLVVRVEGAFALDMQQAGPLVLERVNTHLGWRAVGKLVLKQGPVSPPPARAKPAPPDTATLERIAGQVSGVADPDLRAALERLGAAIAQSKGAPADTAS
ncbi:MAG: DciA family protein [Beijerinckiaceae bacterium]|nr:DciA family protein [Beijerinckiaceae bacterium]